MTYVRIEGHSGLVRDLSSGAILNRSQSDYDNFMAKQQQIQKQKQSLEQQADEINNIKAEISEIKDMLKILIGKQNG